MDLIVIIESGFSVLGSWKFQDVLLLSQLLSFGLFRIGLFGVSLNICKTLIRTGRAKDNVMSAPERVQFMTDEEVYNYSLDLPDADPQYSVYGAEYER